MVIVSARFDFDMLADHVESSGLQELDVEQHRFVGWRRKQSVGPPALIKRSPMKDFFAIERESQMPVGPHSFPNRSDSGVGFNTIQYGVSRVQ